MHQIGFMQGRLCDQVGGKIQAFPWRAWEEEFPAATALGIHAMEWTLDQECLLKNPLMTAEGRARIHGLQVEYPIAIPSLTGDCFMQAPFWKDTWEVAANRKADFLAVCNACSLMGVRLVVVPLVDCGSLDNTAQEDELVEFLLSQQQLFAEQNIQVILESDYGPEELGRLIERLPIEQFGVNYDIGNSAALGFDPVAEFAAYGTRVLNVHVKDRMLGGTTVPLKTGAAQFELVFEQLANVNYRGNFILQTARAVDADHAGVLGSYYEMTRGWISQSGLGVTE
ncbi:TIM barrel protein [Mycolicibacterium sp.]|uniref:sugar phosphate isomerase/epimerase family protein n=1 Tax=Mycolicibacterium sp. TaxID=2320850 RepID=UPI0025F7674D|nr:TIM barrel protein [Mycolicibacterium sp.]MCB9409854.1 TIM barrel protein [Mycolicibacterium sp.]